MTEAVIPEFDWPAGCIRFSVAPEAGEAREWSVVVCGDWAPFDAHVTAMLDDPAGFYGDLLPILQDADLAIVNLEAVPLDEDLPPIVKDGPAMRIPTAVVCGLTAAPFHLACLANNHVMDYGRDGLARTMELLTRNGVQCVGAGLNAEAAEAAKVFEVGPTRLAVLNVAEGEEARSVNGGSGAASLDGARLQGQLASLRNQADVVVVIAHAGREHLPIPAPHIRDLYHSLAEAGADLVIGHHPHVPQGIEFYKGALIAYSLGNFAFLMESPMEYHRLGYFLKIRFCGSRVSCAEIWPYHIMSEGLRLVTGERLQRFLAELKDLSGLITNEAHLADVWEAYADRWLVVSGIQELADSIGAMGARGLLAQSILKASLPQSEAKGLINRLARSVIWRAIHWLERGKGPMLWPSSFRSPSPVKSGASILRNRFDTPSHRELYLTALQRVMDSKAGQAPKWADRLLQDWNVFQ